MSTESAGASNRGVVIDSAFRALAIALVEPTPATQRHVELPHETLRHLIRAQFLSRHLDLAARAMRKDNRGYYTIGSSGHEGNVAVAHAVRVSDPAFLHYRSGAFFLERARQAGYADAVRDVLLGMAAARTEPIAGGRHKVWGNLELAIPPQTSTIASHLPKAVGAALALELRARVGVRAASPPDDAIIVASFGDASINHSTAQGAFNAASYLAHQGKPVPVLFVCEDNGLGISVPTAPGWVAAAMQSRPHLRYVAGDGLDLASAVAAAQTAVAHVRETRRPAFLHLSCVRLLGHAGSDAELAYRSESQIRATEARDPLLASARLLVETGAASPAEVLAEYEAARRVVSDLAEVAMREPGLRDADDVMSPIAPRDDAAIAIEAARVAPAEVRARHWRPEDLPEQEPALTLAAQINRTLRDLCLRIPQLLVFGEDVGKKGGIYGLTRKLQRAFGHERVFDTLLDEQFVLGLAIGAAHVGMLPICEIPYLAFLHNAEDQLRGEAATLQFFSQGQFRNPMVVRVPAYGYQKGFGGHFHNDNSIAVLRDIPGLIIASPSRGDDAAAMLRTCVAAARVAGSVCVYLEPLALYHTADLYAPGDGRWLTPYRDGEPAVLGRGRVYGEGDELLIVTFANGVPMSLRVAARLAGRARVLDLRWLAPLPVMDLVREARACHHVLVVDETRATGGVGEGVVAALADAGLTASRVASKDSFIPLGPAAELVLLSEAEIEAAALAALAGPRHG